MKVKERVHLSFNCFSSKLTKISSFCLFKSLHLKKFIDKILGALTESEQRQVVRLVEKIMAALVE